MLKIDCNNQKWLDCAYPDNRKLTNGPKTRKFLSKPSCCFKSVYYSKPERHMGRLWTKKNLLKSKLNVFSLIVVVFKTQQCIIF